MDPELLEALKTYLKENLSVAVTTNDDWECFNDRRFCQVKVEIFLDREVIATDYDSFSIE